MDYKSSALIATALLTLSSLVASSAPAQAHVSVYPGVSATGSTSSSLTAGQSGYLNFRIGHGCTDETGTLNPVTGLSMSGTVWATHSFAVEVPVIAQGTGSTIPKAEYIPGWKTSVTKNASTGNYMVEWTAVSSDFDVPDAPDGGAGGKQFAEFGISVKWAASALGDVYFKTFQTCDVDMSTKPAKSGSTKIQLKPIRTGAVASVKAGKSLAGQTIVFYGQNGFNRSVTVSSNGTASVWLSHKNYKGIKRSGQLLAAKNVFGETLGFVGGKTASRKIYIAWDVTDGSGADSVMDDTEHNTAPKVTVLAAS